MTRINPFSAFLTARKEAPARSPAAARTPRQRALPPAPSRSRAVALAFAAALALCLPQAAADAEPRVVVTVKPLHALVAGVMAGIAEPYLIVQGAASPHTYAMKPSDAAALQSADFVFRVGPTFERFLEAALESSSAKAEVISLIEASAVRTEPYRTGAAWQADGHGGHDHHHHKAPTNGAPAPDPHIWLDPDNAIAITAAAAQALGLADPRRLTRYAANAAAMSARLLDLKTELQATLTPVKSRPYLVYHDAYQYFETAFGVPASGAVALGEGRAPGAKTVRALRARVAALAIRCIFTEPQFEPKLARALAQGTSARIAVLDPVGADIAPGPAAYATLMRRNAKSLADCLQ